MNSGFTRNVFSRFSSAVMSRDIYFFAFLFLVILILRGPTLFNDYYNAHELDALVQVRDFIAGDIPGKDFAESKKIIYHLLYRAAHKVSYDYGWAFLHLFTIFIVFFTSSFVYLTGKRITGRKTAMAASLFYGIMISSFNSDFMATGREIVCNLFLSAGFFFFIILISSSDSIRKKALCFLLTLLMAWCAFNVSTHGIILIIFLLLFSAFYIPYREWGIKSQYFAGLAVLVVSCFSVFFIGYLVKDKFVHLLVGHGTAKINEFFAAGGDYSPADFLFRFIHRQGILLLWHFILWVPSAVYTWLFLTRRFKGTDIKEAALMLFTLTAWITVFSGGSRIYFHYFITVYPFLALTAAISLARSDKRIIEKINRHMVKLIIIPALFFFLWNIKDIAVKHFYPESFYSENPVFSITRQFILGADKHYLLPAEDYRDAADYIKNSTKVNDAVFVWGEGPYINYYAERRMGGEHLRMKSRAGRIAALYADGTRDAILKARKIENEIIAPLVRKRPAVIADVSGNGFDGFHISLKESRHLYKYVKNNYYFDRSINGIDIYRRR